MDYGLSVDCEYIDVGCVEWKKNFVRHHANDMLNVCNSMIEFDGLPETIPAREIKRILQTCGYALLPVPDVIPDKKPSVFFGNVGGEQDRYGLPTNAIISNPGLNWSATLTLHKDVVMVRHDTYIQGLLPVIRRYGCLLADAYQTLYIATINSRIPAIISADTSQTYKAAEDFFGKIKNGELSGVYDTPLVDGFRAVPFADKANNEITNIIELIQYLSATEWNKLGLNANYNMKREAINSVESQLNNDALYPYPDDIVTNIQTGLDEYAELTGIKISVRLSSAWKRRQNEVNNNGTFEPETKPF